MRDVFIGIDLGTTVLKAAAFDGRTGKALAVAGRRLPVETGSGTVAARAGRGLVAGSGRPPARVGGGPVGCRRGHRDGGAGGEHLHRGS